MAVWEHKELWRRERSVSVDEEKPNKPSRRASACP